jgi:hypothetical protein
MRERSELVHPRSQDFSEARFFGNVVTSDFSAALQGWLGWANLTFHLNIIHMMPSFHEA